MCAVAASTGLNVGGITIHRLFQLPVEHEGLQAVLASKKAPPKNVSKPKATLTSTAAPHRKDSKPGQPEAKKGNLTR